MQGPEGGSLPAVVGGRISPIARSGRARAAPPRRRNRRAAPALRGRTPGLPRGASGRAAGGHGCRARTPRGRQPPWRRTGRRRSARRPRRVGCPPRPRREPANRSGAARESATRMWTEPVERLSLGRSLAATRRRGRRGRRRQTPSRSSAVRESARDSGQLVAPGGDGRAASPAFRTSRTASSGRSSHSGPAGGPQRWRTLPAARGVCRVCRLRATRAAA